MRPLVVPLAAVLVAASLLLAAGVDRGDAGPRGGGTLSCDPTSGPVGAALTVTGEGFNRYKGGTATLFVNNVGRDTATVGDGGSFAFDPFAIEAVLAEFGSVPVAVLLDDGRNAEFFPACAFVVTA